MEDGKEKRKGRRMRAKEEALKTERYGRRRREERERETERGGGEAARSGDGKVKFEK